MTEYYLQLDLLHEHNWSELVGFKEEAFYLDEHPL